MDLQKMLVKSSPFLDECEKMKNEPCPYGEKCNYGKKCRYLHEKTPQTRSARNRHFLRMYGPKTKENVPQQNLKTSYNNHHSNLHFISQQQQQRSFENFNLPNRFASQQSFVSGASNLGDFCVATENQKRNLGHQKAASQSKMARNGLPGNMYMGGFGPSDFAFPIDAPDVLQANQLPCNIKPIFSERPMFNGQHNIPDQKQFNPWSVEVPTFSPEKPLDVFSDLSLQHPQRKESLGLEHTGMLQRNTVDCNNGFENNKSLQSQYFSYFSDGSSQSDDGKNSPTGSYVSSTDFSSFWLNDAPRERATLVPKCQQDESVMEKGFDVQMASKSRFSPVGYSQPCVGFEKNQEMAKSVRKFLVSNENVMPVQDNNGPLYWRKDEHGICESIFEKKSENVSFARNWAMENSSMTCSEMGKTSPKNESKGKENVMLKIDSKVEDYNCVNQVLTQGKEAQILTVMKNHPTFNRQQIVEHVLTIATNDCCSSQMVNVEKSMEHCANLIGSVDSLNFVKAFLSAETRPEVNKEGTVFTAEFNRQVIRNILGTSPQPAPVWVA